MGPFHVVDRFKLIQRHVRVEQLELWRRAVLGELCIPICSIAWR